MKTTNKNISTYPCVCVCKNRTRSIVRIFLKASLLTLLFFIAIPSAKAEVITDETFAYPIGDLQGNGDWTESGSGGVQPKVTTPALTYLNSALSGIGNAVQTNYASGASDFRSVYSLPATYNSGTLYLSFLYRADANQTQSQSEVIGLGYKGTSNYVRVWHGKNGGSGEPFGFGVTRASGSGGDIRWMPSANNVSKDNIHFLVLKYDLTGRIAYLFVNPTLGTDVESEFLAADSTQTAMGGSGNINCLYMRQNGNSVSRYTISGLRVSTTWAEAVAVFNVGDLTPPAIVSTTPGNGATVNAADVEDLVLRFDEKVKAGTAGDITLYKDGSIFETISYSSLDFTTDSAVRVPLQNVLDASSNYHVNV
ncbi:MAG: Ig-like domain-containing protein, partial [Prevotellaceae bacterium]|nr:Ig-like domain-containing protein [Prevotellaceae bacterium]